MPHGPALDQSTAEVMDKSNCTFLTSKMVLLLFASYDGPVKRKGRCGREELGQMSLTPLRAK